jgi:hypothetical protein
MDLDRRVDRIQPRFPDISPSLIRDACRKHRADDEAIEYLDRELNSILPAKQQESAKQKGGEDSGAARKPRTPQLPAGQAKSGSKWTWGDFTKTAEAMVTQQAKPEAVEADRPKKVPLRVEIPEVVDQPQEISVELFLPRSVALHDYEIMKFGTFAGAIPAKSQIQAPPANPIVFGTGVMPGQWSAEAPSVPPPYQWPTYFGDMPRPDGLPMMGGVPMLYTFMGQGQGPVPPGCVAWPPGFVMPYPSQGVIPGAAVGVAPTAPRDQNSVTREV